jgi:DNA-directed RNA polymerase subunit RPC12/RpoP
MSAQGPEVHQLDQTNSELQCSSCGSKNLKKFESELAIHFPGLKNIDKRHVWVFPVLVVCLDCRLVHFTMSESELRQLAEGST